MKNVTKTTLFFTLFTLVLIALGVFIAINKKQGGNTDAALSKAIGKSDTATQLPVPTASHTPLAATGAVANTKLHAKSEEGEEHKHAGLADKDKDVDPDEKGGFGKRALIEGAFKLEFKKTRDLKTNTIPKYRLVEAAKYADILKARAITNGNLPGFSWVERGPNNIGGRTRAILPDMNDITGNTVWAGSVGGGLWKTTNALSVAPSPVWKAANNFFNNLAISSIAQNPQNPKTMYFGTGEAWYNSDGLAGDGIWKSADGGNAWNQLSSTEDTISHRMFAYTQKLLDYTVSDTEYLFACTYYGGVQLSKDGGKTWKEALGPDVNSAVTVYSATDIVRGADGAIYASLGIFERGGIYKSVDNGASWVQLKKGLPASGYARIVLACAPSDSMRVYALIQDSATYSCKGVYRSDSAGKAWYAVLNPNIYGGGNFAGDQAWYALTIGVDPRNANRIIVGGLDLAASQDGGKSWGPISQWYGGGGFQYVHADHHAIVFDPRNSNRIYFGNDGGVFLTFSGKTNVPAINQVDSSYNVTQFYHAAISPVPGENYLIAGAQDNGNIQFTQAGLNPGVNFTGGDGGFEHIDDDNPNIQIASYVYGNYYVSTDGFVQTDVSVSVGNGSDGLFINPTDYDSRDKSLYGSDNYGMYHVISQVGKTNSISINTIPSFQGQVTAIRVSPNKRKRVFFGLDDGTLFMIDNASATTPTATKIDRAAFPAAFLSCIAVEPGNDSHLLVCFSNFGLKGQSIWETKNGGGTWAAIAGNLPDMPIRSICFKPYSNSAAIIGTDLGVWSTDTIKGTLTVWGESNTGLARVSTDWVDYRKADGTLFAATHGRGLYTSTSFVKPVISYTKSDTSISRTNAKTGGADCRAYQDIPVLVQLSSTPSAAANIKAVISSNSLVQGVDYMLLTTGVLTFSSTGTQVIKVRVYNTPEPGALDTLNIGLSLVNGNATNAIVTPFPDFKSFAIFINNQQLTNLPVQTSVDTLTTAAQFVGPGRTVYFYDGTPAARVIASIKNNSTASLGCLKLAVDRAGNNANVPFLNKDSVNYLASKTFKLLAANTAASGLNYTLTLYYTAAEISKWSAGSGKNASLLKMLTVKNHTIRNVTPTTPYKSDVSVPPSTSGKYNSTNFAFSANFTSIDSLQGFGIGDTVAEALPVTLVSFEAKLDKENVLLTWKTATEVNNSGFEVQRSTDGYAFTSMGFVAGNGTTSLPHGYGFTDDAVPAQTVFYRLKQINLDGAFTYSNIVAITKGSNTNTVFVAQNPFQTQFSLVFKGDLSGRANIDVFDMGGKKVFASVENVQSTVPVNLTNASSGIYIVTVTWHNKRYMLRVAKN